MLEKNGIPLLKTTLHPTQSYEKQKEEMPSNQESNLPI